MKLRALSVLALILASFTVSAHADWPMQRHDAARTATGASPSSIDTPAIAFRHYLGGALGVTQLETYDVDANGSREILLVVGGAVVAKTSDDVVVWETPTLDAFRLDAIANLDGMPGDEIVVSASGGRVYVLDARTGDQLWALPLGAIGVTGAVRLGDLDRDGRLDLYVADNACGSTGSLGDAAEAWSFGAGFGAAARLFQLERGRRDYVCGGNDTLADVDGDGQLDVVIEGNRAFYVYSGVDGTLTSTSVDLGSIPYGTAPLELGNIDADPQVEIVAYTDNTYDPSINSRRVFVLDWSAATSRLELLWQRSVVDVANDRHGYGIGGLGDLDGDGDLEIATSFYDGATAAWSTVVLDAATGAELATASQGPFVGLVDLDRDGTHEVLTTGSAGTTLYRLSGASLASIFVAPQVSPFTTRSRDATHPTAAIYAPLVLDVDHAGDDELVALSSTGATPAVVALSAASDPPTEVARLALEANITVLVARGSSPVTRAYDQLLIARSDGYLWILDDALAPTNAETSGVEFASRGLRIGGFYSGPNGVRAAPLAADLDGLPGDELLVRTSRGFLARLSASDATLVEPPRVDWEVPGAHAVIVDVDGAGPPEVVHWSSDANASIRAIRAADATLVWSRMLGSTGIGPTNDLMFGDVSGDGTVDLVYSLYASTIGTVRIGALSGDTGAPLWPAEYETLVAGSGLGVGSLWDRDLDGALDVLATPRNLLLWLRGQDGTAGAAVDGGYPDYGVLANLDADPEAEIVTSGTVYGVRTLELDLTERWNAAGTLHTRVDGALATCAATGTVYVTGHNASPRLTAYLASTGEIVGDIALRAGLAYAPAEVPDGPGQLGNVTVSPNLTGSGAPGVLVPSTDGYLYAIDPCAMTIVWALDLRYPVGEAILADIDGDGDDEIVTTAADGFLHGIDREVIPGPLFVYENDGTGPALTTDADVDDFITTGTLHANWAAVTGATAYEYAVITPEGSFVTSPEFVNVGGATSADPSGLPLSAGRRYLFAVRAINAEGSSSEVLSDGVIVRADPCDMCTVGQVCVASTCVPDPCTTITCRDDQMCTAGVCVMRPTTDGGVLPGRDGGPRPPATTGGGCCSASGARPLPGGLLALALALLVIGARRRLPRRRCDLRPR